jgi:hypothetical protein
MTIITHDNHRTKRYVATVVAVLAGIAAFAVPASAARGACEAYGQVYQEGGSYTISGGEFGTLSTYVCSHGNWYGHDGLAGR